MEQQQETIDLVRILAGWAKTMPGQSLPDFAEKVSVLGVRERPAYNIQLQTLFDVRSTPKNCVLPYHEGEPLAGATDIWSHKTGLKADFIGQEEKVLLPISTEPERCDACDGSGSDHCKKCFGSKSMACPECTAAGRKSCSECGGLGRQACVDCGGRGFIPSSKSERGSMQEVRCTTCFGS